MHPDLVRRTTTTRLPTHEGTFHLSHYVDSRDRKEHLALVMGDVRDRRDVLVRVHSECFTGDVLGSQRCDCGEQLHEAMRRIAEEGQGILLYLRQEGRGIGLEQKLKAYNLQDQGYDTVDANLMLGHQADEREYSAAAAMLADLGVQSIQLMTNNPAKIDHLEELGVHISARLPLTSTVTKDNAAYLTTKIQRMRHLLALPVYTNGHSHDGHTHDGHTHDHVAPAAQTDATPDIDAELARLRERVAAHNAHHTVPFVTLSYAQTLDGTIGNSMGEQLHISGHASLVVTHRLRGQHDAILVGIGTLLADNPRLTARYGAERSPQPIIVDSHLRTPLNADIWSHPLPPWIATLDADSPAAHALQAKGARVIAVPPDHAGRVDLAALMSYLGAAGVRSLMVEGGATMLTSFLQQHLANYAVVTIAPRFASGVQVTTQDRPVTASIAHPRYTQAGDDILLWGELAVPTTNGNHHYPSVTASNNFLTSPSLPSTP